MTPDQLVKHFGGTKSKAARALGVSTQTIYNWYKLKIPIKTQAWIQIQTGGRLKADKVISRAG